VHVQDIPDRHPAVGLEEEIQPAVLDRAARGVVSIDVDDPGRDVS
jgi:hypothetical protein